MKQRRPKATTGGADFDRRCDCTRYEAPRRRASLRFSADPHNQPFRQLTPFVHRGYSRGTHRREGTPPMDTSLARLAESALDRYGDYPSLHFEGVWHSSAELHARATRVAGGLRRAGIAPGERVIVMMANCPEVGVVYHALWRIGAVVTPVVFLVTAP